jgi:Xaa-Pro aminopeptidase
VEKQHAESIAGLDLVESYSEYPGERHPLERVASALRAIHANPKRIAADHDGYSPRWGYRGPRLSALTGEPLQDGEMLVESLRRVKSRKELACLELACAWAGRAHRALQNAIRTGQTEMESYEPARLETLRELVAELPGWRPTGPDGGLTAMFVGGPSTAMPHGFVRGHGVQSGDVLVSGVALDVDGYHSELERTLIVGEPTAAQRLAFEAMLALQSRALEMLAPGVPVRDVDLEVVATAEGLGVESHLRHHVGHSIGLEPHEAPFLDRGDGAVLEPGMVFTVEPGLYYAELGGFRHSDTVVVTDAGCRSLTDYPRDLASLIV